MVVSDVDRSKKVVRVLKMRESSSVYLTDRWGCAEPSHNTELSLHFIYNYFLLKMLFFEFHLSLPLKKCRLTDY